MTKQHNIIKYFNQITKLKLSNPTYKRQVKFFADFFVEEDLGDKGDVTTDLIIQHNSPVTAIIKAKESGILAGLDEIVWLSKTHNLKPKTFTKDGNRLKKGQKIMQITGGIKNILKLERTVLNILQRMSGIATATNKLVKLTSNKVLICPTRKTQWGLLDKKAVTLGGGGTHRLGLYDWILIKDNHIKISNFKFQISNCFFEIEVKTENELLHALLKKPGAIMLDNMTPKKIRQILLKYKKELKRIIIEASGGINEKSISAYSKTGVHIISIGALTHSTKALDISLDIL